MTYAHNSRRHLSVLYWIMPTIFAAALGTPPARATPFVQDSAAFLMSAPPTAGVELTCLGDGVDTGSGCFGEISLNQSVTSSQSLSASASVGFRLTNISSGLLTGVLALEIVESDFTPGSSGIGISIDDPITQAASFSSSVDGPTIGSFNIFDAHSCSVGFKGESGFLFSPTTCGVDSPDHNDNEYDINLADLVPGVPLDFYSTLTITADFTFLSVPEPSSLSTLLLSLGALGTFRLRSRSGAFWSQVRAA